MGSTVCILFSGQLIWEITATQSKSEISAMLMPPIVRLWWAHPLPRRYFDASDPSEQCFHSDPPLRLAKQLKLLLSTPKFWLTHEYYCTSIIHMHTTFFYLLIGPVVWCKLHQFDISQPLISCSKTISFY